MNNRTKYLLLLVVVTVGLYYLEQYISNRPTGAITNEVTGQSAIPAEWLPSSGQNQLVRRDNFTFSYSEAHEQAQWLAYQLEAAQVVDQDFDRPYFEQDPQVKTKSAHWRNYKGSGYDRGHLCPAADREYDYQAFKETFFTSNISPQLHDFNSGVWNYLEQQVRRWARNNDGVFVITGGVFKDSLGSIGSEKVTVPGAFYKIIVSRYRDDFRVVSFLIPHRENLSYYKDYLVTIDQIEQVTGIDFFEKLPESEQAALESRIDRLYFDL